MKRVRFLNSNKRIMVTLSFALLLLVTTTLTGSSLQFVKPAMAKKGNNLITGDDVSPAFMTVKTLNDDAVGHSHGWNPDGQNSGTFSISDSDVSPTKFVHILADSAQPSCEVIDMIPGQFHIDCSHPYADGAPLRYIIINLPEQVVTSASSSSFVTPPSSLQTISSPFSSLGEH